MRFDDVADVWAPAVRSEVQGWLVTCDEKARAFKASEQPDRRGRQPWPKFGPWWRNDEQYRLARALTIRDATNG